MRVKILLTFFVFSFIFKPDYSFDQDLGRHLKLGEVIWQTKAVPTTNLFSYTNPNFPFINTHWLFEVWTYLVSQINLNFLLVFKLVIYLTSVWLILKMVPKNNSILLLPIGFIFFHTLRERIELRPEFFSFLFTVSTCYILEKYLRGPTKLVFLLPFIQLIWVNTHIYFFVGLILQAIFLIDLTYQKLHSHIGSGKLKISVIILILSVLTSLVNPNGLAGFLYPLNVTKNYGYTIVENQTIFLLESIDFQNPNFIWVKISLGIILLSILVVIPDIVRNLKIKKSRDPLLIVQDDKKGLIKNILLAAFGAALASLNVRSFPYLVFLSLPAVLQNFGPLKSNWLTKTATVITAILLIITTLNNFKTNQFPNLRFVESGKKALDFTLSNNLPGPIYNNFDIGSYIIYRGYPKYQVFVDGRPEAYPAKFFSEVYIPTQADYSQFKNLEKQYNFKTIIFSITDQTPWGRSFLASVAQDNTWKAVYLDNFMVVLTKQ
ncbi:hypothetical protein HYU93_03495 [Candidatus Daviesbacteria bacterium]|nr:hypothetical protein [Candidatus Daviesbacteria bacterium]